MTSVCHRFLKKIIKKKISLRSKFVNPCTPLLKKKLNLPVSFHFGKNFGMQKKKKFFFFLFGYDNNNNNIKDMSQKPLFPNARDCVLYVHLEKKTCQSLLLSMSQVPKHIMDVRLMDKKVIPRWLNGVPIAVDLISHRRFTGSECFKIFSKSLVVPNLKKEPFFNPPILEKSETENSAKK